MTAKDQTDFDPRLADWLEADPNTAPEPTLQIVLAAFPSIRQRRAMRVPWRFPTMSTIPKLAIGAAVVTAIALGGFMILRPPSTQPIVGVPGPTASPSPTADSSASSSIDTSGWLRYTSEKYGYSAGIPARYSVSPALSFWVVPESASTLWTEWDTFHDPLGATDFEGTSVALPAGTTYEQWVAAFLQNDADPSAPPGDPCVERNMPVLPLTIDGHDASLRVGCGAMRVLLSFDGRVYNFAGWKHIDETQVLAPTDPLRTQLEAWFTTIKLDPASAQEPPATVPVDWTTYTSSRFAYTIDHPTSWSLTAAKYDWPKIGLPEKGGQTTDVFGQMPSGVQVYITSVPLASGKDAAALLAEFDAQNTAFCNSTSNRHDITLDGVTMRQEDQVCAQSVQVVEVLGASKDRFFEINLVTSVESPLTATDRATFDRFLSSFRFGS